MAEAKYLSPFKPWPWQVKAFASKAPILLLTGTSAGGKSRCAGEKVHAYCLTYPGSTALIVRKTENDLETSSIPFMLNTVIDIENEPQCRYIDGKKMIVYTNGSVVYFRGMAGEKQRKGIRSIGKKGGLDFVWMEEAIEFEDVDLEELKVRMRGNAADWRQIILTTNTDHYLHWINVKLILGGGAQVVYSHYSENEALPGDYAASLDSTTGETRARLRDGRWTTGSGVVIDQWLDRYDTVTGDDGGGNVTTLADYIPGGGSVVLGVDDGYAGELDERTNTYTPKSHPRVFLLAQLRSDDTIAIFDEDWAVETLAPAHIDKLLARLQYYEMPTAAHIDRSAVSLQEDVRRSICPAHPCNTSRDESIIELNKAVGLDKSGRRRVLVHPRCRHLRNEMGSWAKKPDGTASKLSDNGPDALRYLVWNVVRGVGSPTDIAVPPEVAARVRLAVETARSKYREAIAKATNVVARKSTS